MKRGSIWRHRSARWRVSGRLSTLLTAVSIMMIALFLAGCGSSRKASERIQEVTIRERIDSLWRMQRRIWIDTVPMEEARIEIPVAELKDLPKGAEYHAKSGRAGARVRTKGDTIVVWATCDSVWRLCEYYEREIGAYKRALEEDRRDEETVKERRLMPFKQIIIAFMAGAATGIVSTIIIRRLWQRRQC